MRRDSPEKEFIPAPPDADCACNDCPFMKKNSLEAVHRALDVDIDDTTSGLFRFASGATGYLATMWATTRGCRVAVFGEHGVLEWRNKPELEFRPVQGDPETRTFPAVDIERAEVEAFADAIAGRKPYPVPRDEVLNGIAAFEAVTLSSADGDWKTI